jgi:hypothetical protein
LASGSRGPWFGKLGKAGPLTNRLSKVLGAVIRQNITQNLKTVYYRLIYLDDNLH